MWPQHTGGCPPFPPTHYTPSVGLRAPLRVIMLQTYLNSAYGQLHKNAQAPKSTADHAVQPYEIRQTYMQVD